jgi:hypothetical protein
MRVSSAQDDGGALLAHRAFWGLPSRGEPLPEGAPLSHRTITELCYIDNAVPDGVYLLNLGVSPIAMDAAPSRPLLFPLHRR